MKRFLLVLPTIALLGGCATLSALPPPTPAMILGDVRFAAHALCGLQPAAVQIQHVVAANNAGASSALEIARLVCSAVAPQ